MSSQDSPRARVDTSPSPPPSLTAPTMPVEQLAPTSRRPTQQRGRNSHVPRNGTRRTRKDIEGSQGREVKPRNRGSRADDEDGDDDNVHHGHVEPQQPQTVSQTADVKATDTTNPYANGAGTTTPVGRSYEPLNDIDGVKLRSRGGRELDNEDGEDVDVDHTHAVPQGPHTTRQTAVNKATDTTDPNATCARPAVPVGTSYGPPNRSNEVKGGDGTEVDEDVKVEDEGASGNEVPSSDDDGGDEVRHPYA
ncbi:hypothetical protein BDN67DRAFT_1014299, partial [Paxillus ammoniavirescens]